MSKPGKKKKKVLFVVEIVVLLLFIGGLYAYGQISSKLDKIEQPELDEQKIYVNAEAPSVTGYSTYVLFGIDTRGAGSQYSAKNSDTMIIVSVNNDTKEVKMASVYRDTLLNVGNDTYTKANAAYAYGGPEQAISMLNTNLDLNITDYATADFSALVEVVDELGGLDIPLSYAEIEHMNNYCQETSKVTGKDYTPVEKPDPAPADQEAIIGTYHLNGVQVTSYCRIRYTASLDMGRTERQRKVLGMLFDKAKKAGLSSIFNIMDKVFPMVQTSLSKQEILKLIPTMIGYKFGDTTGFPSQYKFSNVKGSIIVPTTLESNVAELHKFLYNDMNYTPSSEITARSEKILEIVGGEGKLDDAAANTSQNDGTDNADDTFIWSENTESDAGTDDYYSESSDTGYTGGNDNDYDDTVDTGDTGDTGYDDTGDSGYDDTVDTGDTGDTGDIGYDDTGDTGDTGYDDTGDTGEDFVDSAVEE
ncbi:MAG: LCP family protein [Clostridia bacterium]|nr:LCP family protein [Clostridia bacterium]MDY5554776.1 LCP family protein [Blautia sp.]